MGVFGMMKREWRVGRGGRSARERERERNEKKYMGTRGWRGELKGSLGGRCALSGVGDETWRGVVVVRFTAIE